jgi:hypothetical protein
LIESQQPAANSHLPMCRRLHRHRAPSLIGGVAEILQGTIGALRLPRDAESPAVQDQLMRKKNPFFTRDNPHQILLDLAGIFLGR